METGLSRQRLRHDTTIDLYFAGQPGGILASIAGAPGDTHADLILRRDAFQYSSIAAQTKSQGCIALHVRTTAYDGPLGGVLAGPITLKTPWHEPWTRRAAVS